MPRPGANPKALPGALPSVPPLANNGNVDFQKIVSVADELSEQADGVAETFNSLNDTLMQRLDKVKGGARSRSSNRDAETKSEAKATRS